MKTGPVGEHGFPRENRLLSAENYSRVFDGSEARASHKHLLILARTNQLSRHRLGLVIAKKNVRKAVQRNRVKRLTREFFRQLPAPTTGFDAVVLARRGIDGLDNAELTAILQQQWGRLERHINRAVSQPEQDKP